MAEGKFEPESASGTAETGKGRAKDLLSGLTDPMKRVGRRGLPNAALEILGATYGGYPESSASGSIFNPREIGQTSEQADNVFLNLRKEEFERLNLKSTEVLNQTALAYERIAKDQEEIEQLKMETRAMLARLHAA